MKRITMFTIFLMVACFTYQPEIASTDCGTPGCEWQFHPSDFNPSGPFKGTDETRFPNDFAKTFFCDAPWQVQSLDTPIPFYLQIDGTDVDAVNEMQCVAIYNVSGGDTPPEPEEDFWGNYQFTPDHSAQIYKVECGGCNLEQSETGLWYLNVDSFLNDGSLNGVQSDGTALTPRNLGYTELDLGSCITFTVRIIYEETANWTDIHDQDLRVYLAREPLPRLDDWYFGDPHSHTWSTYYFLEIGASGAAMFRSMQAAGLHWELVSDHAYNMSDSKWETIGTECTAGTQPGTFIALRGEECDDGYTLGDAHHFLAFNISNWIETYESEPHFTDSINNICGQGGFSYGAHTTTDGWLWSDNEVREALAYACFRGLQDYNERNAYESEDILHPWGNNPHTGQWESANSSWNADLEAGIRRWDLLVSEMLDDSRHEIFFLGGSDAHSSMNYHVGWDVFKRDILFGASSNALGKTRSAVYCSGGLTQAEVLNGLYHGRVVVTDGPFVVMGIGLNGEPNSYSDCDIQIGDTADFQPDSTDDCLFIQWVSSPDYGEIKSIRILMGDEITGETPQVLYEFDPADGMAGTLQFIRLSDLLPAGISDADPNPDIYLRAVATTFDPVTGSDTPGDVSIGGYDPSANNYNYRSFTNPIWLNVLPAPTPAATATPNPKPLPVTGPMGVIILMACFGGLLFLRK